MDYRKESVILKIWEDVKFFIFFVFILALLIGPFIFMYLESSKETKTTYELQEIENGKYVYYQKTVSRVPAYNYEIATIRANGTSITINGDVNIVFTDTDKPYAEVTYTRLVNDDEITVYVSSEQVEYLDTISIH